jgi:predicted metal-dependent hydrolase
MQNVRIIRSQRKTLSIEVHPDGEVWVRSPQRVPKHEIERILAEKQDWIQRKTNELATKEELLPKKNFYAGERFLYQGYEYPLVLSDRARPPLTLEHGHFLLFHGANERAEAVFANWYRVEARRVFGERLAYHAALTGLKPGRLRISSAKTRWGSCSLKTLALNWRLILAPPEVLDYVILHELAHLKIKNHQRDFWILVGNLLPDYAVRRKWLKDHGHQLRFR